MIPWLSHYLILKLKTAAAQIRTSIAEELETLIFSNSSSYFISNDVKET
jgi:hypothetical protein